MMNNLIAEAVNILSTENATGYEKMKVCTVLEDANSPVTRTYQEKLYQSIIDKGHIDFGDIPNSKGNIKNYSGYGQMMEVLSIIHTLSLDAKNMDVVKHVDTVIKAIRNIESLSSTYVRGFDNQSDYVMLEYNSLTYSCIEATTTLLYTYIDFVKRPDKGTFDLKIMNNKIRANLFYIEQLEKFNNVYKNLGPSYRRTLETFANKGRENFTGAAVLGTAAISIAVLSIIPIIRSIIYTVYRVRDSLSASLALQAKFLEMNKTCVEANDAFTVDQRKAILSKQEQQRKVLLGLAYKIKVKSQKGIVDSKKDLALDNKVFTIDKIKNDINDSPMELL